MEKGLEMTPFRPIILNELNGADVMRSKEAAAFLMEQYPTAMPRG
jgi:hypothetical protein